MELVNLHIRLLNCYDASFFITCSGLTNQKITMENFEALVTTHLILGADASKSYMKHHLKTIPRDNHACTGLAEDYDQTNSLLVLASIQEVLTKLAELVEYHHKMSNEPNRQAASKDYLIRFKDHGILSTELLRMVQKSHGFVTPENLLKLLENVRAISMIRDGEYIMPAVIPYLKISESKQRPSFVIIFLDGYIPTGMFCCLVTHMLANPISWKVCMKDGEPLCLYRNCFSFQKNDSAEIVTLVEMFSYIEVHTPGAVSREVCREIRECVHSGIKSACRVLGYHDVHFEDSFMCLEASCNTDRPHVVLVMQSMSTRGLVYKRKCSITGDHRSDLSESELMWLGKTALTEQHNATPSAHYELPYATPTYSDDLAGIPPTSSNVLPDDPPVSQYALHDAPSISSNGPPTASSVVTPISYYALPDFTPNFSDATSSNALPDATTTSFSAIPDAPPHVRYAVPTSSDAQSNPFATFNNVLLDTPPTSHYALPDGTLSSSDDPPDVPLISSNALPNAPLISSDALPDAPLISSNVLPNAPPISSNALPDAPLISSNAPPNVPTFSGNLRDATPTSFSAIPNASPRVCYAVSTCDAQPNLFATSNNVLPDTQLTSHDDTPSFSDALYATPTSSDDLAGVPPTSSNVLPDDPPVSQYALHDAPSISSNGPPTVAKPISYYALPDSTPKFSDDLPDAQHTSSEVLPDTPPTSFSAIPDALSNAPPISSNALPNATPISSSAIPKAVPASSNAQPNTSNNVLPDTQLTSHDDTPSFSDASHAHGAPSSVCDMSSVVYFTCPHALIKNSRTPTGRRRSVNTDTRKHQHEDQREWMVKSADAVTTVDEKAKPSIRQLMLTSIDNLNFIESIGTKYHDLGIILLEDDNGTLVDTLKEEHHRNAEAITRGILQRWLRGTGRKPTTWRTLAVVLKQCNLTAQANAIDKQLVYFV